MKVNPRALLAASLSADELFSADGTLASSQIVEKITGTIQGTTVPTVLVQPMLAKTPINAARDLGPVVDINASFSSGASREISVTVAGLARFEAQATIDTQTQAIQGKHLLLSVPQVHPDLVQSLAKVTIDRPADLNVRLSSFVIPPGQPLQLTRVAATGMAVIRGPLTLTFPDGSKTLALQGAQVAFNSPALGEQVQVEGSATVDDAGVTFKHNITNLFNKDGALDPLMGRAAGTAGDPQSARGDACEIRTRAPADHRASRRTRAFSDD